MVHQSETHSALRVDNICAEPEFTALLETAIETCLADPENYQRMLGAIQAERIDSGVDSTAQKLGVWGVRYYAELLSQGPNLVTDAAQQRQVENKKEPVEFISEADAQVQDRIEAFGRALLDEAFVCLGRDAPQKVREFNQATTTAQQIEAVSWLIERVSEIRDRAARFGDDEENEDGFRHENPLADADDDVLIEQPWSEYHPLRLSPKLIGYYPEIDVAPTCLGVSMLVASFFEKAGVPYLHAGVALTAAEAARYAQRMNANTIEEYCEISGRPIPDPLKYIFERVHDVNQTVLERNNGYHAAVIARFSRAGSSGNWAIIDPNYRIFQGSGYSDDTSRWDEMYGLAQGLAASVRGVDLPVIDERGMQPMYFNFLFDRVKDTLLPITTIDEWLRQAPADITIQELVDKFMPTLVDGAEPDVRMAKGLLSEFFNEEVGGSFDNFYIDVLKDTLRTWVFEEDEQGSFASAVGRCQYDDAYRWRRAEDLQLVPFIAVLRLASEYGNAAIRKDLNLPHAMVEAGLPAYRLGACVLSDFAVQCGFELPASFWLSNWAGTVALTEHLPEKNDPPAQTMLARAVASYLEDGRLQYNSQRVIICEFLEQGETENGI